MTMQLDNELANNANEIANLFLKYFKNVYFENRTNSNLGNYNKNFKSRNTINIDINLHDISTAIHTLKMNSNSGPDNIPNMFLLKCCDNMVNGYTSLLNF